MMAPLSLWRSKRACGGAARERESWSGRGASEREKNRASYQSEKSEQVRARACASRASFLTYQRHALIVLLESFEDTKEMDREKQHRIHALTNPKIH